MNADDSVQSYVCRCRMTGRLWYILWLSGDNRPDRVLTDGSGGIRHFGDEADARGWASSVLGTVSDEPPAIYDLDAIADWCRDPGDVAVDCTMALNAWNLFADLPLAPDGVPFVGSGDDALPLYNKVFWGCNLPAVTPPNEHFEPNWSPTEIVELKTILSQGIAAFSARLAGGAG